MKDELEIKEAEEQIQLEKEPVAYDTREYPVEVLIDKFKKDEFIIPKYQRAFVWEKDNDKMSLFIESIILDLPIQYLFFADEPEYGKLEIVDGSQRLRTLCSFCNNEFELSGLSTLDRLNGFKFCDLPEARQRRFMRKTLRSIELTEKASSDIRQDLFSRINSKPYDLVPMEVRKGTYDGPFLNFIYDCAKDEKFIKLCPITKARIDRQEDAELVLRYFTYSNRYEKFIHRVDEFLDEYIENMISQNNNTESLKVEFDNMLIFIERYFENGFKKGKNHKSTPRVRFEALSVGVTLALRENDKLVPSDVNSWLYSDEFKRHTTSDASNSKIKVASRVEYVRDKLLGKI
jgi:hypothetical protein